MRSVLATGATLAAMLAPSAARTEIIDMPPPVGGCLEGVAWDALAKCHARARYATKTLRDGNDWKLLELEERTDRPARMPNVIRMLALYVHWPKMGTTGKWMLGGYVPMSGSYYDVLSATKTQLAGIDHVWKLELGQAFPTTIPSNDSGASVTALVRYNRTIYCGGLTPNCTDVFTACEVLVRGRAWYAFRGAATWDPSGVFVVAGDRVRGGRHCRMPERVTLHF